jgi:hypothetical protein
VATPRDLLLALGRAAPNGPLALAVLRGGERRELALPQPRDEAAA